MEKSQSPRRKPREGFDVTCVIGRVEFGDPGHAADPRVAAFMLIAEHGAPGLYSFPNPDGTICTVDVEHQEEA